MKRHNTVKYHITAWVLYSVLIFTLDYIAYGQEFNLVRELVVIGLEIWIFYSFLWSLTWSGKAKRYFLLPAILFFCCSFGGTVGLNYFRGQVALYYHKQLFGNITDIVIDALVWYIHFAIYALGYFYFKLSIQKLEEVKTMTLKQLLIEKEKLELMNKNSQLQQELLQSENNFLRAQINPHFLYNCLNLFYSETFEQQPRVAEAVMMLSQIMRYSITDFSGTGGMANLEDEVAHIERVIALNKLRFAGRLQVAFLVQGDASGKMIVPMLLMTLVENVFKHGNLLDNAHPATITCIIEEADRKVRFLTDNKPDKSKTDSSGVGIKNIRHRLQLLYQDDFQLRVTNDSQQFRTALTLPYFDIN